MDVPMTKTDEIIAEIEKLREQLRAVMGTPAESAVANELAVRLADLRAIDEELHRQVKAGK